MDTDRGRGSRALWDGRRRAGLGCLGLLVLYFVVPVSADNGVLDVVIRAAVSVLLLAAVVSLIFRQVARVVVDPAAPLGGLLVGVVAGLMCFALADFALAVHRPEQFTGLATRLDALYFALTTALTVGFGDITARGQGGRALVTAQMLFNITVLAGSVSLLTRRFYARTGPGRG